MARELHLELPDDTDADELHDKVDAALAAEGVLWLTDKHGRRAGVPVDRLAYVEIGSPDGVRRIGFATQ